MRLKVSPIGLSTACKTLVLLQISSIPENFSETPDPFSERSKRGFLHASCNLCKGHIALPYTILPLGSAPDGKAPVFVEKGSMITLNK